MGRLPDQISANLAMVTGMRQSLDSYSMQLRTEQDRLNQLDSQLEEMRRGTGSAPLTSSAATAVHAAEARITGLRQELAQAQALGYTERHPEIVRLQTELAQAQRELTSVKQPTGAGGDALQTDPVYKQRLADRDEVRLRINTLRAQSSQASAQIGQYQSRVEAAPMVEQDLASISRDVELERARFADLKKSYDNARSAEDFARKEGGERFSVLYPASPGVPAAPLQQVKLLLLPIVMGLALGATMSVGREFMDRSVHDASALQSEFDIPVLGEIPKIHRVA